MGLLLIRLFSLLVVGFFVLVGWFGFVFGCFANSVVCDAFTRLFVDVLLFGLGSCLVYGCGFRLGLIDYLLLLVLV